MHHKVYVFVCVKDHSFIIFCYLHHFLCRGFRKRYESARLQVPKEKKERGKGEREREEERGREGTHARPCRMCACSSSEQ